MVLIIVLSSVVAFSLLALMREDKLPTGNWSLAATLLAILGGVILFGSLIKVGSMSGGAEYTTVVIDGKKSYCEYSTFEYDASYLWPGWVVHGISSDEETMVCYPVHSE